MLVVLSLGWAALQAGRFALPPLLPRITETLPLSSGTVGLALTGFGLVYFVVGGLTNFLPLLLVEHGGFSEAVAGGIFALLFAVGMVTKPAAGALSDRFPRVLVSVVDLLVAAVGLAAVLLAGGLPAVVAGTILLALGYKTQFPIADAVIVEAAPVGSVGGDLGAARGAFLAANAVGPGFVGVVADLASYEVAFWALGTGLLASAGVLAGQHWRERAERLGNP